MELKKQEGKSLGALLAPLTTSLVQPVVSSVVKGIIGRGVGKVKRSGEEQERDTWIKVFSFTPSFKQYWDY